MTSLSSVPSFSVPLPNSNPIVPQKDRSAGGAAVTSLIEPVSVPARSDMDFVTHLNTIVDTGTAMTDSVASSLLKGQPINKPDLDAKRQSLISAIGDPSTAANRSPIGGTSQNASAVIIQGTANVETAAPAITSQSIPSVDTQNPITTESSKPAEAPPFESPTVMAALPTPVPSIAREAIASAKAQSAQSVETAIAQAIRVAPTSSSTMVGSGDTLSTVASTPAEPASSVGYSAIVKPANTAVSASDDEVAIDIAQEAAALPVAPMAVAPISRQQWQAFTAGVSPTSPTPLAAEPSPFIQPRRFAELNEQLAITPPNNTPGFGGLGAMGQWLAQLMLSLFTMLFQGTR